MRRGRVRSRRAGVELAMVAVTLCVWVLSKPHGWHIPFILLAIAGWASYVLVRLVRDPRLWATWGLADATNGWKVYAGATAVGLLAVLGMAMVARPAAPSLPLLAWPLYAVWAFVQEFAVQCVVVAGLLGVGVPRGVVPILVGVVFAGAHWPVLPLAGLALCGGVAWTWMFLRWPNLWLLAASHAVVGVAALVLVLGANPVGGFYGVPLR